MKRWKEWFVVINIVKRYWMNMFNENGLFLTQVVHQMGSGTKCIFLQKVWEEKMKIRIYYDQKVNWGIPWFIIKIKKIKAQLCLFLTNGAHQRARTKVAKIHFSPASPQVTRHESWTFSALPSCSNMVTPSLKKVHKPIIYVTVALSTISFFFGLEPANFKTQNYNLKWKLTWKTVTMAQSKESKFLRSGMVSPFSILRLNLQPNRCIPSILQEKNTTSCHTSNKQAQPQYSH